MIGAYHCYDAPSCGKEAADTDDLPFNLIVSLRKASINSEIRYLLPETLVETFFYP